MLYSTMEKPKKNIFFFSGWLGFLLVNLLVGFLLVGLYAQQQTSIAIIAFALTVIFNLYAISRYASSWLYVLPSLLGIVLFIIFPLIYTLGIGFSNYSAANLLSLEQSKQYFLDQKWWLDNRQFKFNLYSGSSDRTSLYFIEIQSPDKKRYMSEPFNLVNNSQPTLTITLKESFQEPLLKPLTIKKIIALRESLDTLSVKLPNGLLLRKKGLRSFAAIENRFEALENNRLLDKSNHQILSPNFDTGFYENSQGESIPPGFVITVGWENYLRVFQDASIRDPFVQILLWTIVFAAFSVLLTLCVGLVLANLLQWEQLQGKAFYRLMLMLPYCVPAFISILVFRGLFNQNFGEINLILEHLFGVRPTWFSDPTLARSMILIVNTWLGYPYFMLLCMGLLQSIPKDLYEASALDGATPVQNLIHITLPNIIKPLIPLMIASFAFNFNNFVLIALLTNGSPDIIGASTPAGTTDLLVNYTYRIAFQDSGQNFGLASAIAAVIFIMVAVLSLINMKLSKVKV